jgi:hypothetical protein
MNLYISLYCTKSSEMREFYVCVCVCVCGDVGHISMFLI